MSVPWLLYGSVLAQHLKDKPEPDDVRKIPDHCIDFYSPQNQNPSPPLGIQVKRKLMKADCPICENELSYDFNEEVMSQVDLYRGQDVNIPFSCPHCNGDLVAFRLVTTYFIAPKDRRDDRGSWRMTGMA